MTEHASDSLNIDSVLNLFHLSFSDLLHQAHSVHRQHFNPHNVQLSTLLSVKTGACPEDCKYCPQSGHYHADIEPEKLLDPEVVVTEARKAKSMGATRFCMGAAWRSPTDKGFPQILSMVESVKAMGMETCMTLGMLDDAQAEALSDAGLDYYNHNLDTSPDFYANIITTRTFNDRLQTLRRVREAGMKVCTGGIVGMGESLTDRAGLLLVLAQLEPQPESVPINQLVAVPGTPLEDAEPLDPLDFVRTVAVARILMPNSVIRLSAGRESMSESTQALAFYAGANSLFYGDQLLTTGNPEQSRDGELLSKLGMIAQS